MMKNLDSQMSVTMPMCKLAWENSKDDTYTVVTSKSEILN